MPPQSLFASLLLLSASTVRAQQGCCCAVARAESVLQNVHEKLVSGCARARCNGEMVLCSACNAHDNDQGCRFCGLPATKTCGKAACDDWCLTTNAASACSYLMCAGCSICDSKSAASPPAAAPPRCETWWCGMHPAVWNRKCLFSECGACPECRAFRFPSAPPSTPRRLSADTTDLEPFFATHGVAPLPLLDVSYSREEVLYGSPTRYCFIAGDSKGGDMHIVQHAPTIRWDVSVADRALVFMMDLDAGGRASADGAQPGPLGPYVLAIWTDCTGGSLAHCRQLLPYRPPNVRQGTNRIAFLQLRQVSNWVRGVAARPFKLNLTDFLSVNYPQTPPSSVVLAYNFFYLSGSEEESDLDPQRQPPWDEPPPSPPPPPPWRTPDSPSPPPPPEPPTQTWWGGNEIKRPWEH